MTLKGVAVIDNYPPPAEFAANANATTDLYDAAEADRLAFWEAQGHTFGFSTLVEGWMTSAR